MTTYQYKRIAVTQDVILAGRERTLARLGRQGWELVTAFPETTRNAETWIFKRVARQEEAVGC